MPKCPLCHKTFINKSEIISHVEKNHKYEIPEGISTAQYIYMENHNGRKNGICRHCNKETPWNEKSGKPYQICGSAACKEKNKKIAEDRMLRVYGKKNLLNDPNQQAKMLANRHISGTYTWSDGKHKFTYTGSYEKFAIEWLDTVMDLDPETIQMPGPILPYDFNGETKYWITDIYLSEYNLIIEIKDGGENTHPGFAHNRDLEAAKDKLMLNQKEFNYIKITHKSMMQLVSMLNNIRLINITSSDEKNEKVITINESANAEKLYDKIVSDSIDYGKKRISIDNEVRQIKLLKEDEVPEDVNTNGLNILLKYINNEQLHNKVWITSDVHILKSKFPNTPDSDLDEFIYKCNKSILPDDLLILLGDIITVDADNNLVREYTNKMLTRLNCKQVVLILGNHDNLSVPAYYALGYIYVSNRFATDKYIFTHYPERIQGETYNIHGHIHGDSNLNKMNSDNHIDVFYYPGNDPGSKILNLSEFIALQKSGGYSHMKTVIYEDNNLANLTNSDIDTICENIIINYDKKQSILNEESQPSIKTLENSDELNQPSNLIPQSNNLNNHLSLKNMTLNELREKLWGSDSEAEPTNEMFEDPSAPHDQTPTPMMPGMNFEEKNEEIHTDLGGDTSTNDTLPSIANDIISSGLELI